MRILIAEDQRDLNQLLKKRLKEAGYSVDACFDGAAVFDYLLGAEYDALVLDIMMPKVDGIQVVRRLRREGNQVPVLLLTARDSIEDRVAGLDAGADDYLIKPFAFEELLARLRVLLRKPQGGKTTVLRVGELELHLDTRQVVRQGQEVRLSSKEFSLLRYMMQNAGIVLSREKLEQHVWDYGYLGGLQRHRRVHPLPAQEARPGPPGEVHPHRAGGWLCAQGGRGVKKLSIQTRLVLFHTAAMTLVVALVLGLLFSLSSQEILTSAQATLEERVSQGVEEVEYTQGRLEFDSELLSLENGVYLSVYQPGDSSMLYGRLPYGFAYTLPLSDGELRTVTAGGTEYSVLDLQFPVEGYGTLVMRGVVSLTAAERDFRATLRLALVLLPLLVALTALCGYLFSRRALRPVAQITQTVQNIQQERDLSKRVRLGEGRDEIYTLAQTFDSLLDQVEASFSREKQFTSDVAHELRTPLSVALMQCEELLAREDMPPEARQQVEVIRRKVDSMAGMVSQLLLLSRADQGREKLALEELDLSELSELVAQEFAELAGEKGIALAADIQPGVAITGDQTLLLRLWGNLLQNAVTYGKEGGHIWMKLSAGEGVATLQVRDDGVGIAPDQLPKIWERFYQVDPARSGESSGLGLSMVRWIAQAHGGTVQAESALGEGSTFTARLPLGGPEGK